MNFNLNNCKYNFSSDNVNIFVMLYDISSSMRPDVNAMREANQAFVNDFSKFEEKGSIAVAKGTFDHNVSMSNFSEVKNFDTSYYADGWTALYKAIEEVGENTIAYYNELVKRLNITPRITFLVFSDGEDTEGGNSQRAKEVIMRLNSLDATTVFVAFREATHSSVPENLGFNCRKNITDVSDLISCMGNELSKSCKEQSRSAYSLKSQFFSKAAKDADEDNTDSLAAIDDDFFNV